MINKLLISILATGTLAASCLAQDTQDSSKSAWHDVPSGFALAKQENKPVLTDFYTDWCSWCKKMDHDTFEDPSVTKLLSESFILVRANAEDKGPGEKLAHRHRIQGYPTQIIFAPSGEAKATLVGYRSPAQFTSKLNDFLEGRTVQDNDQ
jgi:thiol:disulfide interchange protein